MIDGTNYNADHNNATTEDLSVLSGDYKNIKDLSGEGSLEVIYKDVDIHSYKRR